MYRERGGGGEKKVFIGLSIIPRVPDDDVLFFVCIVLLFFCFCLFVFVLLLFL